MSLYFSIADTSFFIPYIALIALAVGGLSSFLGIGGGFILTPLLITLGVPSFIAVGTGTAHIFFGSLTAVIRYHRQKAIPYHSAITLTIGGAVGALIGSLFLKYLSTYTDSLDYILKVCFIILLCGIALLLCINPKPKENSDNIPSPTSDKLKFLTIGSLIGCVAGFLGIGGGFLIVPILIYIMHQKKLDAMAMSQFNIMCVTAISLIIHIFINQNIDFTLAAILIFFGIIGAQIGLTMGQKAPENISRYIFLFIVLGTIGMLIHKF